MNPRLKQMTLAGMLIALGVIIPMFSPIRVVLEPASFTLASHVVIFIAMFISPTMAVAVTLGTTFGFFMGGFPIVVVLRAFSHIVFAFGGATYLKRLRSTDRSLSFIQLRIFSFVIGVVHAVCEVFVVTLFYMGGNLGQAFTERGFFVSVILLVGVGTIVHSMVDLEIANVVMVALRKQKGMEALRTKTDTF